VRVYSQKQGGPVTSAGIGFPFRHILELATHQVEVRAKVKITRMSRPTVSRSVYLCQAPMTRVLLLSDSCVFVDMGRPF
jgi:hypothetical protein